MYKKRTDMKKLLLSLMLVVGMGLAFTSCTKYEEIIPDEVECVECECPGPDCLWVNCPHHGGEPLQYFPPDLEPEK